MITDYTVLIATQILVCCLQDEGPRELKYCFSIISDVLGSSKKQITTRSDIHEADHLIIAPSESYTLTNRKLCVYFFPPALHKHDSPISMLQPNNHHVTAIHTASTETLLPQQKHSGKFLF